jgi:uncharacterized protein
MKIWGYWATLGWGLLAFLVGQFLAIAVLFVLGIGDFGTLASGSYDARLIVPLILISNPLTIAIIALVVIARAPVMAYLGLVVPAGRFVGIGVAGLVGLIVASDALFYFSGYPVVTSFQLQIYTTASAASAGWLAALWIGVVIFGPAGEEVLFRGFLFRGWVRSSRSLWPAVFVISLLWALLHGQYEPIYLVQIVAAGLFLGWIRWASGSILLTFFLHALFNIEATLETIVQLHLSTV